jgi:cytochrome c oxidase cbb3-type subunit 3/ubiquinol-cytochrome c reductase cytochrome c subunit
MTATLAGLCALALMALAGCDLPGKPKAGPEVPRPEEVVGFETLYGDNCAGCHGAHGQNGAAADLANPEYQALVDDASLREVIAKGANHLSDKDPSGGTLMPAFAQENGGQLTDQQIDALVAGIRASWRKENAFGGKTPPPYKATHAGDVAKGKAVYAIACARCHGVSSQEQGKAGSILDGSFLALINEQMLRTTVIAGRPDIGEPDWRGHIPGRAMTDDEVTDVSAWLIAQRPLNPGQPYPSANPGTTGEKPASVTNH